MLHTPVQNECVKREIICPYVKFRSPGLGGTSYTCIYFETDFVYYHQATVGVQPNGAHDFCTLLP